MAKYKAFGTALQRNIATVWTNIAQVLRISDVITADKGIIDSTTHDSTGGYREKLSHLIDQPAFEMVLLFDPADTSHEYFRAQANDNTAAAEAFRVVWPDSGATDWEFTCFVKGFTVNASEVDGMLQATVTFEPTGAPDFTPA